MHVVQLNTSLPVPSNLWHAVEEPTPQQAAAAEPAAPAERAQPPDIAELLVAGQDEADLGQPDTLFTGVWVPEQQPPFVRRPAAAAQVCPQNGVAASAPASPELKLPAPSIMQWRSGLVGEVLHCAQAGVRAGATADDALLQLDNLDDHLLRRGRSGGCWVGSHR